MYSEKRGWVVKFFLFFLFIGLCQEKYINVSNTLVQGTSLGGSFEVINNTDCATYCYENPNCEAFHFVNASLQCSLYDLQSVHDIIPTNNAVIWITGGN